MFGAVELNQAKRLSSLMFCSPEDICGTLAMIDINSKKLEGEAKDFQQGSAFHQHTSILASDTYEVSEQSDLVVITAGVAQQPGETRLSLVDRNANIMKKIMPEVIKHSPKATILIVSDLADLAVTSKTRETKTSKNDGR